MVNVGIVGLGPDWETRYLPVLRKLRQRISVRAVYDPIAGRAAQSAAEFSAGVAESLSELAMRRDIGAVMLLDAAWHRDCSLDLLQPSHKPIFIASQLDLDGACCTRWHRLAASEGQTLMPAMGLRYTPASVRLQELMATRLGAASEIHIDARMAQNGAAGSEREVHARRLMLELIDWTRYFAKSRPAAISSPAPAEDPESEEWNGQPRDWIVHIQFGLRKSGGPSATASIRLKSIAENEPCSPVAAAPNSSDSQPASQVSVWMPHHRASSVRLCLTGEKGSAVIESPTHIHWKPAALPESRTERLLSERSEIEVMLDHFCRRVVGGLIPVADFGDISLALSVLEAARRSQIEGQSILIE